jgi:UDP-glucose 4-epimerase
MIGSALVRHRRVDAFAAGQVPWGTEQAPVFIDEALRRFADWVGEDEWAIVWSAGAGVMRTGQEVLDRECVLLDHVCAAVSAGAPPGPGGFYLVSSAGGAFAGSAHPPFGVDTPPVPLNAYGRAKLAQEGSARSWLSGRLPVTVGRVGNAYGPGQDLTKQQGLVTELCRCALLGRTVTIFAPPTTLRDYIYSDDVADMIVADLLRMVEADATPWETRVVASGRSVSIAELISLVEMASGRRVLTRPTFVGTSHLLDLRLVRQSGPPFPERAVTPIEVGIARVFQDVVTRLGRGELAG